MRGRRILLIATAGSLAATGSYLYASQQSPNQKNIKPIIVPKRDEQISKLKGDNIFDVLIIGGGATGAGAALDAATRGLKVALVEKEDFAAGTSSRSTKLIHGGVRYLENAFLKLDMGSFTLVFDALQERSTFLQNAPHLTKLLPIMTPCYQWWELPYYWAGLKVYDLLAGTHSLHSSRYVGYTESVATFPMIKKDELKGSVVYYDGQMNDSRVNVSLALTAAINGATVANHVEVVKLLKGSDGKLNGARVKDTLTGNEWDVKAKVIVNATGPFTDAVRKMADPSIKEIVVPSAGVHIVLPYFYSPSSTGMIVPKTKDGRVVFLLPWQGQTLAGTTDSVTEVMALPKPKESEIQFILEAIAGYVDVDVRRNDVIAAWSGIRPLVKSSEAKSTASLSRDHHIEILDSGLISIAGGKWTTYRKMAEDVINKAIELGRLKSLSGCVTKQVALLGAENWTPSYCSKITQNYLFKGSHGNYRAPMDISQHLSESYGTRASLVAELAQNGYGNRLVDGHPFIEAEVIYAAKEEYACTAVDVIGRRTRLAFLDTEAATRALPKIIDLMGSTLNWNAERKKKEMESAMTYLQTMNIPAWPESK